MTSITIVCPHCQQASPWSTQNPFRPFCSERCKLIDLGDWIDERHVIAGDDQTVMDNHLFDHKINS